MSASAKPVVVRFQLATDSASGWYRSPVREGELISEIKTDSNKNNWRLRLVWGDDSIGVYLHSMNKHKIDTNFSISMTIDGFSREQYFEHKFEDYDGFAGTDKFVEASGNPSHYADMWVLGCGRFDFDVTIQVKAPKSELYQPPRILSTNMLKLLESGHKTDVSFCVEGKTFGAHAAILRANAPILANFCEQQDGNATVTIEETTSDVFEHILRYVYAEVVPTTDIILSMGKELIDAANRYGLVLMKLALENVLVQECIITKTNVCEYILFADAKSCSLLKEYAISYFLLHAHEILGSEHSSQLKDSAELLTELMMMVTNPKGDAVTVTELRKELGKLGLDVDGTKEALVSRLDGAKRQRTG